MSKRFLRLTRRKNIVVILFTWMVVCCVLENQGNEVDPAIYVNDEFAFLFTR